MKPYTPSLRVVPKAAGSAVLQFMKNRMGCGHLACRQCSALTPVEVGKSGCIAHKFAVSNGAHTSVQTAVADPAWRCACEVRERGGGIE